ncbi:MAG: methionyl-tRNA formyltransferase [Micavibrio aeruginosavorus]|uniref:Methionyl-tRNA formyltransferase n=1 Tax=Micavibrio aeruginosavorus TaxID=349221 RepID=A0A2W5FM16_9BACT|nr:MAG: methionyl-tRNA formyltransferase [Micavibrio aeruginosavorus]
MTDNRLRIIYMGTPDFSVPALQTLIDSDHEVIAVYSREPKPKGRGQQIQKTPVHELADKYSIPVFTPKSFKKDPEAVTQFQDLKADIAIVAAYGLILPLSVLNAPKFGCLNIHASLLPRWRGASPIQHAIWKGDQISGVTIMQMEEGLDTGPMLLKREMNIESMTTPELHDALSVMGAEMVVEVLQNIPQGERQNDAISIYAPMLKKEDGLIDWHHSAIDIDRQVRALNPWPGTYTSADGKRLKILKGHVVKPELDEKPGTVLPKGAVMCGGGFAYQIEIVQPENSKPMDAASAINGHHLKIASVLQ